MTKRKSGARPENSRVGEIYLIRHIGTDAHKIGITLDWYRRAEQLDVGLKSEEVAVARVLFPGRLEKQLHRLYDKHRLPQSEWFHLSAEQVKEVVYIFASESAKYKASIESPKVEQAPREPKPYLIATGKSSHVAPEPGWARQEPSTAANSQNRARQAGNHVGQPQGQVRSPSPVNTRGLVRAKWTDCIVFGFASTFMPVWLILSSLAGGSAGSVGFFMTAQVLAVSLCIRSFTL